MYFDRSEFLLYRSCCDVPGDAINYPVYCYIEPICRYTVYVPGDAMSYRMRYIVLGDAISYAAISYSVMLYRTVCCYIVLGDAISYRMLLYRTR